MNTPEQLCQEWLEAKAAENSAKAKREEIEAKLLEHVQSKPEGSATTKLDGFKVVTTGRINRRVDEGVWMAIRSEIPAQLWPVKHKLAVDDRGVRWLQDNDPGNWLKVSEAFMSSPGKTQVKVEVV